MSQKVTINMVAEKAGVSRGTVDRVINNRSYVKADVKKRVIEAMKELQYVPLRTEQARRLGLIAEGDGVCRLGVVLPNWTGHFKREILRGIEDAKTLLIDANIEVIVKESKTDLLEETVELLEKLKAAGIQGAALCAKNHPLIIDEINALAQAEIPVVTYNSDITDSKRICFVGQDLVQSGRVAAELMSKFISPKSTEKVLAALGNPEFDGHRARMLGFCTCFEEKGYDLSRVQKIKTYNDYSLTYQKISKILTEQEDIGGIYMANRSVTACVEAVRTSGYKNPIHIICHDLTDNTKRALKNGYIEFTVAQNIYNQGYQPLIILRDYLLKGMAPNALSSKPGIEIICAENIS